MKPGLGYRVSRAIRESPLPTTHGGDLWIRGVIDASRT